MKKFLVVTLLVLNSTFSLAQTLPPSLSETMKAMNGSFRVLSAQAQDASMNLNSAQLAGALVVLITHAQTFKPERIETLPVEQQANALLKYKLMLTDTGVAAVEIMAAFQRNETDKVPVLIQKIKDLRSSGHDSFMSVTQ